MRALLVVTSRDRLGNRKSGVRLESFAAGYYTLLDAGFEVLVGSPLGGSPPLDPRTGSHASLPEAARRFEADETAREEFADTLTLSEICAADVSAAYYADGSGALADFADNPDSQKLIGALNRAGRPCAFVGFAVSALLEIRNADGIVLVKGLRVTAPSVEEQAALGPLPPLAHRLRDAGAQYVAEGVGAIHVVADGSWITGQNTASSEAAARALVGAAQGHG